MTALPELLADLAPGIGTATRRSLLATVDLLPLADGRSAFTDLALAAVDGGKRFRALFAHVGAGVVTGTPGACDLDDLAAAIELYQASALAHDDVIDHADQRRGRPTAHVRLERHHRMKGWNGSASDFGSAGALLLGDFLFSAAEAAVHAQARRCEGRRAEALLERWSAMHAEVAFGQYLDVRAEQIPLDADDDASVDRGAALTVALHKSARYSVVHPTVLGAIVAGGDTDLVATLERILTPWGLAFQLRDDALGVFGDPARTGKPVGDDLREGKRTVLLSHAWESATAEERRLLARVIGNTRADDALIAEAVDLVRRRGADAHEEVIAEHVRAGEEELLQADLPEDARDLLRGVGELLTRRDA